MGAEWSPGLENRPLGMPRPFPSLWDQSRGPKSGKQVKKLLVWGLALGSYYLKQSGKLPGTDDLEGGVRCITAGDVHAFGFHFQSSPHLWANLLLGILRLKITRGAPVDIFD